MSALLLIVILATTPLLADVAQEEPGATVEQDLEAKQAEQAKEVLRELAKSEYRSKLDIPAADCLFVEDGKIVEAMYQNAVREHPKAVPAGALTNVSSVKVMEHGIQLFFAEDKCAIFAVSSGPLDTAKMAVPQIVDLAKKSIAPLFETLKKNDSTPEKGGAEKETPGKG